MNYELNEERLKQLTIADLSALISLHKLYPQSPKSKLIVAICSKELDDRINDIIIF